VTHTLRGKLTSSYLLLVIFSLAVAALVVVPTISQVYADDYKRTVLNEANTVVRLLQAGGLTGLDIGRLDDIASASSWRPGVYVGVRDAEGRPPATSRWAGRRSEPVAPEVAAALTGRPATVIRREADGENRIFAAVPLRRGASLIGVVQVSVPRTWLDRALRRVWLALGEALLAGVIAALLLGAWRARALAAPVLELAQAARRISAGDLAARAAVRSRDEIGTLGESFNAMAEELRRKLTAVSEERNKIEAIISSMSDAVVAVDEGGAILFHNRAAEELLGLPPTAGGRRFSDLAGDHPCWRGIDAAAREGREVAEEFSLAARGERILDLHATPLRDPQGALAGAVAVVRDVTELREAERLRRELTANVSHELRTPLTSIKGFAETLLAGAVNDPAACRRFLTIIDGEAARLMKLVDDLMDLSRLESHVVSMEPSAVRLDELAADALSRLRPQAERQGITLRAAVEPVVAVVDRERMMQVITNLLDNAIKFTPEHGTVEVSVRPADGQAVIAVADTGRGIPADDLTRIFDRFYRVDRSRSRGAGGTGLGLAIARHIVEAHGGRITVTSRVNGGSTFSVALPASPGTPAGAGAAAAAPAPGRTPSAPGRPARDAVPAGPESAAPGRRGAETWPPR
jgi:two-component system phosphate regulon sensor histidine kinase PhoR